MVVEAVTNEAQSTSSLVAALMALGDDHLILGHRLSEWCGHAPMLEEDLALPNMGLDMLGQARALYTYAADLEGLGRTEDDLAYLRSDREYRNCLLVERPNHDYAHTMLRQLYFAAFMEPFWQATASSSDQRLRDIAGKAVKEVAYHIRHAGEWVIRLGDGTEESARRMQDAVDALHPYTNELFVTVHDSVDVEIMPERENMRARWQATIRDIFEEGRLDIPDVAFPMSGGRDGRHGEEFGFLLAELQFMQRAYPGLTLVMAEQIGTVDRDAMAWQVAAAVPDPEVPCVTVADLGILRGVHMEGDVAVAKVTPTYSGCPAVLAIELAIERALIEVGFKARIERVLSPAWTTDWITDEGREKLRKFGIAPPVGSRSARSFFDSPSVPCPRCGSDQTERIAEFGSTPCKAQYRCKACIEPFDYFKCL